MESKLYFLLATLFVCIISSTSLEDKRRKNDTISDLRRKLSYYTKVNKNVDQIEENDDQIDDSHLAQTSYANNRYTTYNTPENNYRTRPGWQGSATGAPSQAPLYDDYAQENDWPRSGYENSYPSISSSASYDNEALLGNGPACNSLVDSQYPIFSDTCGAVPQARYTLPNAFGHRERWHVAQALTAIMGSASDQVCTRSLRLLLCPVLFPPCPTRHEPPPVLPCHSYCRAVKARCSTPTLDHLPCELFPYSSDFCPTNQQYGSFIPPAGLPPGPQQFPMPGGFPSSNYPPQRPFPSLQSILSLSGHPSGLTPSSFNSPQSMSPLNHYNSGPYASDSFSSMLNNFPSRSYNNDYQQSSKYAPYPRSSAETRSTSELRRANEAQPAPMRSPMVKA